jgi:ubiquinone/menaquinone biosynthesis C-methylase UbiE
MSLFKRKGSARERRPAPGAGGPAAARGGSGNDWRTYDAVAESYARVHAPRTALPASDLVGFVGVSAGARVLDVGTGTGVVARAAAAVAGQEGIVAGVDASVAMLRQAKTEGGAAHYAAAAAIDLPFRDEAFGFVLASFVLSHFIRYETALFDMLRVLKRGGRFGVSSWGPGEDEFSRAWTEVAERFAAREILQDARVRAMPWAEMFSDPNRLKDVLHERGVRDIQIDRREYRFEMTPDDYLESRETTATGRFIQQMLGPERWDVFRQRSREAFAERFPQRFNDFREVILAVGHKP